MSALKQYIDNSNKWLAMFGQSPAKFPSTITEVRKWQDSVENELSPENLFQDGEANPAKARQRGAFLHSVQAELETLRQELS
jgi:hypothetical protein